MKPRSHRTCPCLTAALLGVGLVPSLLAATADPVEFQPVPEELARLAGSDPLELALWWRQQVATQAGSALVHLPPHDRSGLGSVASVTKPELPALIVLHDTDGRPMVMGVHPPTADSRVELSLDPGLDAFGISIVVFPEEGEGVAAAAGPVGVCDPGLGDGVTISAPSGGASSPGTGSVGTNPLGFCTEGTSSWVNTGPCPPESSGGDLYMELSLQTDGKSEMHALILDGPSTIADVRVPPSFLLKQETYFCVPSTDCSDLVTHTVFAPGKELSCPPEEDMILKCMDNTIDFVCDVDVRRFPAPVFVPGDVGEDGTGGGSASGVGGK